MRQVKAIQQPVRYAVILLFIGSLTAVAFRLHINSFIAGFVYLLPVVVIAFYWGFWEATVASIVSVLCLDYFFTDPLFTLYMADPHDWVAVSAFETVAIVVSRLAMRAKAAAENADTQQARLEKLYRISREALLFDDPAECGSQFAAITNEVLGAEGVALWDAGDVKSYTSGRIQIEPEELRSAYERGVNEDDALHGVWKRVVCLGQRPVGVLCVASASIDVAMLDPIASLAAIAMERTRTFKEKSSAEAARQSEQLRGAVLDGLAHAFKTPLTTIRAASSGLLEIDRLDGPQKELVSLIDEEAGRLADLTGRLLTTAKLEGSRLKVRRERVRLAQIVSECSEDCAEALANHQLSVEDRATRNIWADPLLVKMALSQILDNAAKYSSPSSRISLSVHENAVESVIRVHNEGSFIPARERNLIFTRYYRASGSEHKASGTGIGLAVTKRIAEAHGGSVWVESDPSTGTTFFLTLPRGPKER